MGSAYSNVVCILIPKVNELESLGLSGDMVGGAISAFLPPASPAAESLNLAGNFLAGTLTAIDPDFADVVLLLHMDGTNGATAFPDNSSLANVMTGSTFGASPVPSVDTAAPMFGTGAGKFGVTSLLSTPITPGGPLDINYTTDFTIEGWIKFTTANFGCIMADNTVGAFKWLIECSVGGIKMHIVTSAGNQNTSGPAQSFTTGVWYSFAAVVHSKVLTVYINGVGGVPFTLTGTPIATNGQLSLGEGFGISNGANMELDEVRITQGVARYLTNYTPSGPFPNS